MTNTIKETVQTALGNLNAEANFPLIRFAKDHLNIEMEKASRNMIIEWAKKYIFLNGDFSMAKKILSSLDKTIAYLQDSLRKFNPKFAKRFFNYIQDKYAKSVVNQYLSSDTNRNDFVQASTSFAKKGILTNIFNQFDKQGIKLNDDQFQALRTALQSLTNDIEDNSKTLVNIAALKTAISPLPQNVQNIVLDKILQRRSLAENLSVRFSADQTEDC
jgi:hypothetical protein